MDQVDACAFVFQVAKLNALASFSSVFFHCCPFGFGGFCFVLF